MGKFKKAIAKIKRETTPGVMGLALHMPKALPEKDLEHLTLIIQKFWKGDEDHGVWYTMLLEALYKLKGNTNDPSNRRGKNSPPR
jgi:hypothetical protein